MTDKEIIRCLQEAAGAGASPVEVANLLGQLCEQGLHQSTLTMYFKRAFPTLPLRTLLEAGAWRGVSDGGMSDDDFNRLLSQDLQDSR
jgi:hypothetical protein